MRTHNTGVISSIPPRVTFKPPLVRKEMGNHLMNVTSLEKNSPDSGFFYARNRVSDARTHLDVFKLDIALNIFKFLKTNDSIDKSLC